MVDQALITEAQRRLDAAFDGFRDVRPVGRQTVHYYAGDTLRLEFNGYDAARRRLGADYGEALADIQTGERSGVRELVGIVGETTRNGVQCMLCELFSLDTGDSVAVSQRFRTSFLKKKRTGSIEVLGPAEPLDYTPTDAELKKLISELEAAANARLADRQAELSAAELEILHYSYKLGEDRRVYEVLPQRAGKQLIRLLESKPIWKDGEPAISVDAFSLDPPIRWRRWRETGFVLGSGRGVDSPFGEGRDLASRWGTGSVFSGSGDCAWAAERLC